MALNEFEAVSPKGNVAFVIGEKKLKYIKFKNLHFVNKINFKFYFSKYDVKACMFHSLDLCFLHYINIIPKQVKLIWIGWGFDYYKFLLHKHFPHGFFATQTKNVWYARQNKLNTILTFLKFKYLIFFKYNKQLYNRIDYFAPVLYLEYTLVKTHNTWFKPKYLEWNYGTVEDDFYTNENFISSECDSILVGNNATPENNHLDIFFALNKRLDLDKKKITVPLSYGDVEYRSEILAFGKSLLKDNFNPLLNLVPQAEYSKLINSCQFIFMGHFRQQALGNICILMINGSKIFLIPENPLYNFFINLGAYIFPLDFSKISEDKTLFNPLSTDQKIANKNIIYSIWGRDSKQTKTKLIIDLVNA